jgi:hypothetical protein
LAQSQYHAAALIFAQDQCQFLKAWPAMIHLPDHAMGAALVQAQPAGLRDLNAWRDIHRARPVFG